MWGVWRVVIEPVEICHRLSDRVSTSSTGKNNETTNIGKGG